MLHPVICPMCGSLGKAHGYQVGPALRDHFKAKHPEAEAEIRAVEDSITELKKVIRAKYGRDVWMRT